MTTWPNNSSPAVANPKLSGDTEIQSSALSDPDVAEKSNAPPDGGRQAWLVAAGGFAMQFCTFGFLNSFGVFQTYYQNGPLREYSASDISWIGSVEVFFLLFCGLFSGPLSDRYGIRAVNIPFSIVLIFALMMTSLATEYYQFLLAHGILLGIATGMLWTPTLAVVGQWFTTKRAWAMGVVSSGASVGGVVYPIALNQMIKNPKLGFPWAVRIMAFVMLAILAFGCAVMKEHAPRRAKKLLIPGAFKSAPYVLTIAGFFMATLGFWTPIYYIPEYARLHGASDNLVFYEVAILNAPSFFGRLIPNFMADKLGKYNVYVMMTVCTSILLFCWTAATDPVGITVFTGFYGFFQGAFASLLAPCLAEAVENASDIGTYVGMALAVCSFAALVSQPINGTIIDRMGYLSSSMFSAVMVLFGGILYISAKLILNRNFFAKA